MVLSLEKGSLLPCDHFVEVAENQGDGLKEHDVLVRGAGS